VGAFPLSLSLSGARSPPPLLLSFPLPPNHSVLYGSLAVRSFDWAGGGGGEGRPTSTGARAARLVADRVLTPADPPTLLRPAGGGNIHAFAAVGGNPTAVLDLLAPPYSGGEGGRDCAYFREEGGGGGPPPAALPPPPAARVPPPAPPAWPLPDPARPTAPGAVVTLVEVPSPPWFTVQHGPYRGARAVTEGRGHARPPCR
jgi:hypothetical protein